MLDHEFEKFQRAFVRLAGLFRLRLQGDALDGARAQLLQDPQRASPRRRVRRGEARHRETTLVSKPIDWLRAIPKRLPTPTEPDMTDKQAAEWHRAERLRWEDTPCLVPRSVRPPGVTEKPLRFVPEFTDTRSRAPRAECAARARRDGRPVGARRRTRRLLPRESRFL